ncbi:PadR family transcriptional regulator [Maritalea porphyrae]|uniref:PadR family transcriptional regulator n=1 Tax=Maritalea porphyrae TaxID=880732 RepID=A0ABQ5US34_9HYPH|nr:PadR family transcriptional regulator [Maritalea porphyrae]GLQ18093.1 PadR family transcriptional regulator [Maritalea porphyrae]
MNVKTVCLAILTQGETTGYEIRKRSTEGDFSFFLEASFGSIYPALSKLEEDELVTSRVQAQEGKPAKRIYSITDAGRESFINSLFEDLNDDVFRSEFVLFLRFAEELPRDLVEKRILERISKVDEEIKSIEEMGADLEAKADRWVLEYGLTCIRQARNYLVEHKDEIIAMAQPVDVAAKAAE